MKKLFVATLAIAAMVACSKNDVISEKAPSPISFDNAFVEIATRADKATDPATTTANIEAFDVWGFMDEYDGVVFSSENVTKSGDVWSYENTQYWSPQAHNYYFAALAPMDSKNVEVATAGSTADAKLGLGTVTFTNEKGAEDLIYSAVGPIATPVAADNETVKFQFNHLLSKVKFTFENGFGNDNAVVTVSNIQMTAPAKGSIDLAQADWWSTNEWELANDGVVLAFGDTGEIAMAEKQECANECFTIPADKEYVYSITFDVELLMGGVVAYEGTKTATVEGTALEIGKAYNFKATLDHTNITADGSELSPIKFDVIEVKEWVNAGDVEMNVLPTITGNVGADETLKLEKDYAISGSLVVAGTLDGTMGGNPALHYGLYAEAEPTSNGLVCPEGNATIQSVDIIGENQLTADGKGLRAIYITKPGTYVIKNVNTTGTTYAINVNTKQNVTLTVSDSTLEGWTSYGSSTTATFTNCTFKVGEYAYFRPYGATTLDKCSFPKGFKIDLTELAKNGNKILFQGCTYDGVNIDPKALPEELFDGIEYADQAVANR